jgi:hypothetical protein
MTDETLGDQIDRYLLGRLAGPDRQRLEERMFEDDTVWTAIKDAEDDLIERFVAGDLPPADLADFALHFALSPSRRERIEFARGLPRALASVSTPRPARAAAPPPSRTIRPGLAVAAALVVAAVWLGHERSDEPSGSATPGAVSAAPSVPPMAPSAEPAPADLTLRGSLVRGPGGTTMPRLALPPPGADVRIDAAVEGAAGATCAAALETVEGAALWKGSARVAADGQTARVVVPASVLAAGDYVLRVAPGQAGADRTARPASEYTFRVMARPR